MHNLSDNCIIPDESKPFFRVLIVLSKGLTNYDLIKYKCNKILSKKINDKVYNVQILTLNGLDNNILAERYASERCLSLKRIGGNCNELTSADISDDMFCNINALILFHSGLPVFDYILSIAQKKRIALRVIDVRKESNKKG